MRKMYNHYSRYLSQFTSIPLLLSRFVLAYGFYQPAIKKLSNPYGIGQWFESINYPLPYISAYIVGISEGLAVILLLLGLGTRIIAVPLIVIMLVAIFSVHWSGGFSAANNGFEIPLYYLLMIFSLMIYGSGKLSLDYLITKLWNKKA